LADQPWRRLSTLASLHLLQGVHIHALRATKAPLLPLYLRVADFLRSGWVFAFSQRWVTRQSRLRQRCGLLCVGVRPAIRHSARTGGLRREPASSAKVPRQEAFGTIGSRCLPPSRGQPRGPWRSERPAPIHCQWERFPPSSRKGGWGRCPAATIGRPRRSPPLVGPCIHQH